MTLPPLHTYHIHHMLWLGLTRSCQVAMGEVDINETILASQTPSLLFVLHFVFIIIFAVLLLNLLIALMYLYPKPISNPELKSLTSF